MDDLEDAAVMTHTPGPWIWEKLEDYKWPHVPEYTLKGPTILCRYWCDEQPLDDARLIAAAPDLLAALRALQIQALQSDVNDGNEWGREALQMAVDAITKATVARC